MSKMVYNMGDVVYCDLCGDDFSNSEEVGGFIFSSKAVCPTCEPDFRKSIGKYGEEQFIHASAEPGETFAAFVRRYRGGPAVMTVETFP